MTWIKPSFNWMMYRSGYATKPGQEIVLGIDITRAGFEWALAHSAMSSFPAAHRLSLDKWKKSLTDMPVRIQWDPERDSRLNVVKGVRTIQIGLSGEAVQRYVKEWIVHIEDMTPIAHRLADDQKCGVISVNLPEELETAYPLDADLKRKLCVE